RRAPRRDGLRPGGHGRDARRRVSDARRRPRASTTAGVRSRASHPREWRAYAATTLRWFCEIRGPDGRDPVCCAPFIPAAVVSHPNELHPMGNKLYVANLNFTTTEDPLRAAFGANGRTVKEVAIPSDRETGRPRGFAFVTMASDSEAKAAIAELD